VRDLTGITLDQPPVIPAFGICPWPRRPVSVRKPRAVSATTTPPVSCCRAFDTSVYPCEYTDVRR
jgi:hypothetical protein